MRYLIIGAARSGIASANYLLAEGAEVFLADTKKELAEEVEAQFCDRKPVFLWGEQPDVPYLQPDLLVMSPGVPLTIAPVVQARELNIPVISETELAYRRARCPFIAITGTNGKTTTTSLAHHLMDDGSRKVIAGGNIGTPLISQVDGMEGSDLIVAEMSSFQLESIDTFRPDIAVVLNLTPDHLDRHGDMSAYRQAKMRIFENQRPQDHLILNADDPEVASMAAEAPSQVSFISQKEESEAGMWLADGYLCWRLGGAPSQRLLHREELGLPGDHNLENAMAAALIALLCGYAPDAVAERLRSFKGVAHRMEFVTRVREVDFINDSKGTNPDSTQKAILSYPQPLVLIVGGRNKGIDFTPLAKLMAERCREVVVMGEATGDFLEAFANIAFTRFRIAKDMDEAVELAVQAAAPGDVVLLSPACTSWDQYRNFEERGNAFKKLVNDYAAQKTQ